MSICKGCGAEIIWGISQETKARIPLDAKAPCFELIDASDYIIPRKNVKVSHFATCPKANDFSRKGTKS